MGCKYVKEFEFGGVVKTKPSAKKYARGGSVDDDMRQDKAVAKAAVRKHERNMHPNETPTKLYKGGSVKTKKC